MEGHDQVADRGEGPGVTVADISAADLAPVGSIYYRCATRTHVLISLWLRCIARFQAGILEVAPAQFSRRPPPTRSLRGAASA